MTTIREQLEESQKMCDRATEGPWEVHVDLYGSEVGDYHGAHIPGVAEKFVTEHDGEEPPFVEIYDAEFIAHARTTLPLRNAQLAAVLAIHSATNIYPVEYVTDAISAEERGDEPIARLCLECSGERIAEMVDEFEWDSSEYGSVEYPCPTVQAIEDAAP